MSLINFIPAKYQDGFKELNSVGFEQFDKIKEELSRVDLKASIESLSSSILTNSELESIDIEEIFLSVGTIIPLIDTREMIKDIADDITAICEREDLIKKGDKKDFRNKLSFLLNDKKIYFASKAEDLINDYGNIFIKSRIVSDIRPIFDLHIEDAPAAGIILHNLNIHYQSNEEPFHKDISFILNLADIKSLKEVLIRAESKEESLKKILDKSGIRNLNE